MANDKKTKSVTKSELYSQLSEKSGLTKAQVREFFEALQGVVAHHLSKKGAGTLTLPGLFRLKLKKTAASKGGQKKINQFTGQEYITKPKPASVKVKAFAVKALNESIK